MSLATGHPFQNARPRFSQWTGNRRRVCILGNSVMNYFSAGDNGSTSFSATWSPAMAFTNQGISGDYFDRIYARGMGTRSNAGTDYTIGALDWRSIFIIGENVINGYSGDALPPGWTGVTADDYKLLVADIVGKLTTDHFIIMRPWITRAGSYAIGGAARTSVDSMWAWAQANYPAKNCWDWSQLCIDTTAPGGTYANATDWANQQPPAQLIQLDGTHPDDLAIDMGHVSFNAKIAANGWTGVGY